MANAVKVVTPEMIDKAEALAARGLTMEQIAYSLDLGYSTIYEKKRDIPELEEAIKRGRSKGIATIANCLFEGAKSGNVTSQIFYLKCRAGWEEKQTEDDKKDDIDRAKKEAQEIKDKENAERLTSTES